MSASSQFDDFKLNNLEAVRLNKTFSADFKSELSKTDKYKQYKEKIKEIKAHFATMTTFPCGCRFIPMRSGKPIPYAKLGEDLRNITNRTFKKIEYLDQVFDAWTNVTDDQARTVRALED